MKFLSKNVKMVSIIAGGVMGFAFALIVVSLEEQ